MTTTKQLSKTEKIPTDYKKVNRKRKQRGYALEYDIVQAFNQHHSKQWVARRLGGSSTGLPDIVATNNEKSILYSIECKSGESNCLYIPRDQIDRCKDITDKFLKTYKNRYVVFAFKFKGSKKKNTKLQYRFVICEIFGYDRNDKNFKGVSFNIKSDSFTYPLQVYVELHGRRIYSIDEFVNWK